jgi:hypothetical protein
MCDYIFKCIFIESFEHMLNFIINIFNNKKGSNFEIMV